MRRPSGLLKGAEGTAGAAVLGVCRRLAACWDDHRVGLRGQARAGGHGLWPRGLLRLCFGDTPGGPKECESPDAGELLAATWRALDVGGARLGIDEQLIPTPGGCTFAPPKSKRSERTIALDPDAVPALRDHR